MECIYCLSNSFPWTQMLPMSKTQTFTTSQNFGQCLALQTSGEQSNIFRNRSFTLFTNERGVRERFDSVAVSESISSSMTKLSCTGLTVLVFDISPDFHTWEDHLSFNVPFWVVRRASAQYGSPRTCLLQGTAGALGVSNFLASILISLNSLSSEQIPRNSLILSSFGFSIVHLSFFLSSAFLVIHFQSSGHKMVWTGCRLPFCQSHPGQNYPSGSKESEICPRVRKISWSIDIPILLMSLSYITSKLFFLEREWFFLGEQGLTLGSTRWRQNYFLLHRHPRVLRQENPSTLSSNWMFPHQWMFSVLDLFQ